VVRLNQLLIRVSKTLFSYQIFVVAECAPNARFILRDSQSRSEVPDPDHERPGARGPDGVADRRLERDRSRG
jgi:hypothetical protein